MIGVLIRREKEAIKDEWRIPCEDRDTQGIDSHVMSEAELELWYH